MSTDFETRLQNAISRHVYSRPDPPKPGWLRPQSAAPSYGRYAARQSALAAESSSRNVSFAGDVAKGAAAPAQQGAENSGRVVYVSKKAKQFNDMHLWVDHRGNVIEAPPLRVVEEQSHATAPKVRPKSAAVRRAEMAEFSKEMWKRVNPGYLPIETKSSQYKDAHEFKLDDMQMAKGDARHWKQHFTKTDFSQWSEAEARASFVLGGGSIANQARK